MRRALLPLLLGLALASLANAGDECPPPVSLEVAQIDYGEGDTNAVLLRWTPDSVGYPDGTRVFVDGVLETTLSGDAEHAIVGELPPGPHTFSLEGDCGAPGVSERVETQIDLLPMTPHLTPLDGSLACETSESDGRLELDWTLESPSTGVALFLDEPAGLRLLARLPGDATTAVLEGHGEEEIPSIRIQLFTRIDGSSYGSPRYACTACSPPVQLRLCQEEYGEGAEGRFLLQWRVPRGQDPDDFELSVDGGSPERLDAGTRSHALRSLDLGRHQLRLHTICDGDVSAAVERSFDVLPVSPLARPVRGDILCDVDVARRVLTARWAPAMPMLSVEVLVRRGEALTPVATLSGTATTVSVTVADLARDSLALRFHALVDGACRASPLVSCADCLAPGDLRLCQTGYSERDGGVVLASWELPDEAYERIETLVDGVTVGSIEPTQERHVFEGLSPGAHTLGLRGVCAGGELSGSLEDEIAVRLAPPGLDPDEVALVCALDRDLGRLEASWETMTWVSSISVLLGRSGEDAQLVAELPGDANHVVLEGLDRRVSSLSLRFHVVEDGACHASPLVTCTLGASFVRGDADANGRIDLTDGIVILVYLFLGGPAPTCFDAADANDQGSVNLSSAIALFSWLFLGGPPPAPPMPGTTVYSIGDCGADGTEDALDCDSFAPCS